jgi:ubiquinone/menaquinone biosynthesis C-methylase UbiE
MLARLATRVHDAHLQDRVEPVQADAADTGLRDDSVDLVVSHALLHELFDAPSAFAEWARILKPGGKVLLSDVGDGWHSFVVRLLHDRRAHGPFTVDELTMALSRAGFEQVEVTRQGKMLQAAAQKPSA